MIEEKVECKRLGYEYKDLFEKVVYFIHHTPFAKDYISDYDLKMLSDLDLFLHTGKYEIIEFGTNKTRFDSSNIIKEQKEEITRLKAREEEITQKYLSATKYASEKEDENIRLNNIIDELEKWLNENLDIQVYGRSSGKTLKQLEILVKIKTLNKLKELKEGKYEKSI